MGSIPRAAHSSTKWYFSALPPPDFVLMIRTGWRRGAATTGPPARPRGSTIPAQGVAGGRGRNEDQGNGHRKGEAPIVGRQDDHQHDHEAGAGDHQPPPTGHTAARQAHTKADHGRGHGHQHQGQPPGIASNDGEAHRDQGPDQAGDRQQGGQATPNGRLVADRWGPLVHRQAPRLWRSSLAATLMLPRPQRRKRWA